VYPIQSSQSVAATDVVVSNSLSNLKILAGMQAIFSVYSFVAAYALSYASENYCKSGAFANMACFGVESAKTGFYALSALGTIATVASLVSLASKDLMK